MAEATISLKLTPREFDALRDALHEQYETVLGITNISSGADSPTRAAARRKAGELNDLLGKLR